MPLCGNQPLHSRRPLADGMVALGCGKSSPPYLSKRPGDLMQTLGMNKLDHFANPFSPLSCVVGKGRHHLHGFSLHGWWFPDILHIPRASIGPRQTLLIHAGHGVHVPSLHLVDAAHKRMSCNGTLHPKVLRLVERQIVVGEIIQHFQAQNTTHGSHSVVASQFGTAQMRACGWMLTTLNSALYAHGFANLKAGAAPRTFSAPNRSKPVRLRTGPPAKPSRSRSISLLKNSPAPPPKACQIPSKNRRNRSNPPLQTNQKNHTARHR